MNQLRPRVAAVVPLAAALVLLAVGCGGGESVAPRDPLASSPSTARQVQRNAAGDEDVGGDETTSRPAKSIQRGLREKRYK